MNSQFKKGVLELVVLLSVVKRDMYGYELVAEVSKVVDVNEGIILKPILRNLPKVRQENIITLRLPEKRIWKI